MMNKAAEIAYQTLLAEPNQETLLPHMQTREELYRYLHYHEFEQKLDQLYLKSRDENRNG
jgi:methylisocitrate lyase